MSQTMLPRVLAASFVLGMLAGCSTSTTNDPGPGDGTGTPTGSAAGTTPKKPSQPTDDTPTPTVSVDPTNDPLAKPCTGQAGALYALSAKKLTVGNDVPLCRFEGDVLMIVNTASHCGYTPEYGPLQAMYDKYRAQGFYVLGFPSKSFNQELDNAQDVSDFCTNEYHITFPLFAIANVNMPDEQPVYTWLKAQPTFSADIPWNFEKWIISRHGQVVSRVAYTTQPDDAAVVTTIEAELAKK